MIRAQSAPAGVPIRYGLRGMGPSDLAVARAGRAEPHVALRSITQHLSEPAIECFILAMTAATRAICKCTIPIMRPLPVRTSKRVATPTATSRAARVALTFALARCGSSDELTNLASSGVFSSWEEYPAW
jgi:hypothetical protein